MVCLEDWSVSMFIIYSEYKDKNELIMILTHSLTLTVVPPSGFEWLENPGDYATLLCTNSVLRLSDGKVAGNIFPNEGTIEIMSWKT